MFRRIIAGGARAPFRQLRFASQLAPLDASRLVTIKTTTPKQKLPKDQLVFGKTFTDHMLEIEWDDKAGWGTPKISPYHKLELDPSTIVFHYGFELFEGMKAYRDVNNEIRTFRGEKNMVRMNLSAERIALPTFDGEELQKLDQPIMLENDIWMPQLQSARIIFEKIAPGKIDLTNTVITLELIQSLRPDDYANDGMCPTNVEVASDIESVLRIKKINGVYIEPGAMIWTAPFELPRYKPGEIKVIDVASDGRVILQGIVIENMAVYH